MESEVCRKLPRKKRIWYPGATYHVMSRGNRRTVIFKEKEDYYEFLECMHKVKDLYSFKVHSLCLMTNHFHMSIETEKVELWKIMHKLLLTYAANYNIKYKLTGHLFENRYTACIIEDEKYFLEVSRYIHLNPVKAQMVRDPMTYHYSSYPLFVKSIGEEGTSANESNKVSALITELVDTSRVLSCFNNNSKEQYRMFVEGKLSHAEQELLIQKDMKEDDMWLPW